MRKFKNLDPTVEVALFKDFEKYVNYDLKLGKIWWAVRRSNQLAGTECGAVIKHRTERTPYRVIRFKGKNIRAHRFLFWKKNGYIVDIIHHDNGDGLDNSEDNLVESDSSHNALYQFTPIKSKTGEKGIYLQPSGKYQVQRKSNGKIINSGTCQTIEEAIKLRDKFYAT